MRTKIYATTIGLLCSLTATTSCSPSANDDSMTSASVTEQSQNGSAQGDSLYVGDQGAEILDSNKNVLGYTVDTVRRFNSKTGEYLGAFTVLPTFYPTTDPTINSLINPTMNPTGLIFIQPSQLLVNFQNAKSNFNGAVGLFDANTGAYQSQLVSSSNKYAPDAPRGVLLVGDQVLVADFADSASSPHSGAVHAYDRNTGNWLYDFGITNYPAGLSFDPHGLVVGPDNVLYATIYYIDGPDFNFGAIVRLDLQTHKFLNIFAICDAGKGTCPLHRPEGIVFGPDGNLYVTAGVAGSADANGKFQPDQNDTDKILVYDRTGALLRRIDTDVAGQPRSYPATLLFGPGNALFVPIVNVESGATSGEIRVYHPLTGNDINKYDVLVPPGILVNPTFVSFRQTDPKTLAYLGNGHGH